MQISVYRWIIAILLLVLIVQYGISCSQGTSGNDIAAMTAELKTMNQKLSNIEAGITAIKGDVGSIKGDVATIRGNVATITGDVTGIKGGLSVLGTTGGSGVTDLLKFLPK
jgi:hypothetical protein